MKQSKLISVISISMVISLGLSACGEDSSTISNMNNSNGTNKTTLNVLPTLFTINTSAQNVGTSADYFYVGQEMINASQNSIFNTGTANTGSVITTCVFSAPTPNGLANEYNCLSTYDTTALFRIPDSAEKLILNKGETYTVV